MPGRALLVALPCFSFSRQTRCAGLWREGRLPLLLVQFEDGHKGFGGQLNGTFKDVYGWGASSVVEILKKREYLGHTVNFKTRKHFKDKKSHYVVLSGGDFGNTVARTHIGGVLHVGE